MAGDNNHHNHEMNENLLSRLDLLVRLNNHNSHLRQLLDHSLELAQSWLDPPTLRDLPYGDLFEHNAIIPPELCSNRLEENQNEETKGIDALNELRKRNIWPLLETKALADNLHDTMSRDCINDLNQFFARVQGRMESLHYFLQGQRSFHLAKDEPVQNFYAEGLYTLSFVMPVNNMPPGIRLLDLTYSRLQRCGLKLYEGYVVEEITVKRNNVMYRTHAYRRIQTFEDYLSAHASAFYYPEEYILYSKGGFTHCIDALQRLRDPRCPTIEPDRHVFSFRDGIMLLKYQDPDSEENTYECVWIKYGSEGYKVLPDEVVAANFFDMDAEIDAEEEYLVNPLSIPTPSFDKIFDDQGVPTPSMWQIYAMFGRLLFSVNEIDKWEVFLLLYGRGGVGKSTVQHVIERIYPHEDIGTLSNVARPNFPLPSEIHRKKIILYPETDTNPTFRATLFQQLISGERVEIPRMYTNKPLNEPMIGHIFSTGNKFMSGDTAGSMLRRTIALVFKNRILNKDTRLFEKLDAEMPSLLWKWANCYLQLCDTVRNDDLWKYLDPYFHTCRDYMRAEMNTIHAFFDAKIGNALVERQNAYLTEEDFSYMYRHYCQANGHTKQTLSKAFLESALSDRGYQLTTMSIGNTPTRCIVGVGTFESFGSN